jgi:hypothetical protein
MRATALRVNDLPDPVPYGVSLHCPKCGSDFSATRGDYFWATADHVFRCTCAGRPYLRLTQKITRYVEVAPAGQVVTREERVR